jgi:Rhodanese-related sulfurtransferase
MNNKYLSALMIAGLVAAPQLAPANEAATEAMNEYMMFQDYESGIILPQQIDEEIFNNVLFVDARDEEQFAEETIPGAVHIEWRQVLDRIEEIPSDQKVILFCNTGSLSAQATFALRVAGRDNVVVLQGGIQNWKETAAFKP